MDWLHILAFVRHYGAEIFAIAVFAASSVASLHIILTKRDTRAAIGWIGVSWLVPLAGALLYAILGINRIRRKAEDLREDIEPADEGPERAGLTSEQLESKLPDNQKHLVPMARLQESLGDNPLVDGNDISILVNGDEAYPEMLKAIREADTSVTLATYIFNNDDIGAEFIDALASAHERGVEVRVLVDAAGVWYSFPTIVRKLKRSKVPFATFLPSLFPPSLLTVNLRNHRKLMVVDGSIGFTGGMNIKDAHILEDNGVSPTRDFHFKLMGPIVDQLQQMFASDWRFTTGEELTRADWFGNSPETGQMICRGINDGPDENLDKLNWSLLGVISEARESIQIMTPYFLPENTVIEALSVASMKGIEVDIILPKRSNLPFVDWASRGLLEPLLEKDIRIWLHPPPFHHGKLMVVDNAWSLIGSSNWDPRSLRLNFEYNVECYDSAFAEKLSGLMTSEISQSERLTLQAYRDRSFPIKVRDGVARLFMPYL